MTEIRIACGNATAHVAHHGCDGIPLPPMPLVGPPDPGSVSPPPPDEPVDPAVLMHLGSHWCTTRTEREFRNNLRALVRWYDADQPCPTSQAQATR